MSDSVRKVALLSTIGAVICVCGNSIGAALPQVQFPNPSTSPSSSRFVVLTQPVKVKIAYGETILPAGMKLPVGSHGYGSVPVKYMVEVQAMQLAAARLERAEPPDP